MSKVEILNLINQDVDAAFTELDKVFKKDNAKYNDLNREFIGRPENFSLDTFRLRLRRLVSMDYPDLDDGPNEGTENDYYKALCELDFKQQTNFFERIYKYKKIAPFL